jgi:hypothetical protein
MLKIHKAVEYLTSRCYVIRIQLFTVNSGGHTKKMIIPFCPPDVEKGRRKTGEPPRV